MTNFDDESRWIRTGCDSFETLLTLNFVLEILRRYEFDPTTIGPLFLMSTEHPLYISRFKSGVDSMDVPQTIARLGMAYYWWDAVARAIWRQQIPVLDLESYSLIPNIRGKDDSLLIPRSNVNPEEFLLFNQGGDLDLTGRESAGTIFPITVRRDKAQPLTAADLGIDERVGEKINKLRYRLKMLLKTLRIEAITKLTIQQDTPDFIKDKLQNMTWPEQITVRGLEKMIAPWHLSDEQLKIFNDLVNKEADSQMIKQGTGGEIALCIEELTAAYGEAYHSACNNCPEWVH